MGVTKIMTTRQQLLTIDEACSELRICKRVLMEHVDAGRVAYIPKGKGLKRRHRLFHPDDVEALKQALKVQECRSIPEKTASMSTTSKSNVFDFQARRASNPGVPPKRSSGRSDGKPAST
jgi:hypothetical protein